MENRSDGLPISPEDAECATALVERYGAEGASAAFLVLAPSFESTVRALLAPKTVRRYRRMIRAVRRRLSASASG